MSISWLRDNWFPLIQSLGIVGSLLFAGITVQRDRHARRISDQLLLNEQHQRLWSEVQHQPELARILRGDADLQATPMTPAEEQFLRLAFVHFQNGWLIAREGSLISLSVLARDAADFFRLPGPQWLWKQVRDTHDPEFVQFIADSVASPQFRSSVDPASGNSPEDCHGQC